MLTFGGAAQAPDSFTVSVLDGEGRELVRRSYGSTPVAVPEAVADSALQALVDAAERNPALAAPSASMRAELRAAIPPTYPPADRILMGIDHSIWVRTPPGGSAEAWLVLDPDGEPVNRVELPPAAELHAARLTAIWVSERDELDVQSIAKYRVDIDSGSVRP